MHSRQFSVDKAQDGSVQSIAHHLLDEAKGYTMNREALIKDVAAKLAVVEPSVDRITAERVIEQASQERESAWHGYDIP